MALKSKITQKSTNVKKNAVLNSLHKRQLLIVKGKRQTVVLVDLIGEHACGQLKRSAALRVSDSDHESVTSTDLKLQIKF